MRAPLKVLSAGFTLLLSAISAMAIPFTPPAEGHYTGTVKITRILAREGLSSSSTVKAQARVDADGKITMLTTVPELPADAVDVMKAFNFAVPIPDMYVGYPPNPLLTGLYGHQYVVDRAFPGYLTLGRSTFKLTYSSPAPPTPGEVITTPIFPLDPQIIQNPGPTTPLTEPVIIHPPAPTVTVEFNFRMTPKPAAARR